MMKVAATPAEASRGRRTAVAGLAAMVSLMAASSCCLPVLPFVLAASLAGSSAVLTALRPYLVGASVLFIAYGFYHAWQGKRCGRKPGRAISALLWTSAFLVFLSIFFPQALANAAANLFAW